MNLSLAGLIRLLTNMQSGPVEVGSPPGKADLGSWWGLEQASGNRPDSHGSNTLVDNNAVGSSSGKVGVAALFDGGDWLARAEDPSLTPTSDFTISAWALLDTNLSSEQTVIFKGNHYGGWSTFNYFIEFTPNEGGDYFRAGLAHSIGGALVVANSVTVSLDTWYFLIAWFDDTANTWNFQVNNGTIHSGSFTQSMNAGAGPFTLGRQAGGGFNHRGNIDEPNYWDRVLTADEREWLYNNGDGRAYGDLP